MLAIWPNLPQTQKFLKETASSVYHAVTQTSDRAINNLNLAEKGRTTIEQINSRINEAIEPLTQTPTRFEEIKNQAFDNISTTAQQTKEIFVKTVVNTINNAQISLEDTRQKAGGFYIVTSDRLEDFANSLIDNWIHQHPILGWIFTHPFLAGIFFLVVIIIIVFLLWGLLEAIAFLAKKSGLIILRTPWLLIQSLFTFKSKTLQVDVNPKINSDLLATILEKLDAIQKEQRNILQQLAELKERQKTF
jgi:hypothetical protein